jgi:hypothetical protein
MLRAQEVPLAALLLRWVLLLLLLLEVILLKQSCP